MEFTSLAHLVQKLMAYEHYHPELYQDKFKRHVNMAQAEESDDSGEEQEVAVAEWTRGANPVPCKWIKQQGLVKGFDFDVTKAEQIFDLLLRKTAEAPRESQATNCTRAAGKVVLQMAPLVHSCHG